MKDAVNFQDKFSKFSDQWSPKFIVQMNDYHFELAKVEGDFTWHDHKDSDEVFTVIEGSLRIDYRDKQVHLNEGKLHVVQNGAEHKPFAEKECKILPVEPAGTLKTGDAGGDQTAPNDTWI